MEVGASIANRSAAGQSRSSPDAQRTPDGKSSRTSATQPRANVRRLQQRNAFRVAGHREQVEGPELARRVAELGEGGEVASQGGGVAGDVATALERGRRSARRRAAGRPRAAGRARRGRTVRRTPWAGPARPGRARHGPREAGSSWRPGRRRASLRRPRPDRGPDRVGEERGEQPDAGVEVEHPLPGVGLSIPSTVSTSSRGASTWDCRSRRARPRSHDCRTTWRRARGARLR